MEVAGPGKFSARTDKAVSEANLNPPSQSYGEGVESAALRQAAPMAQDSGQAPNFADLFGSAASRVIPMGAPSQQPNVPVTDGAASGAGQGPEALNLQNMQNADLQQLKAYLPVLEFMANQPNASFAARNLVRVIKGS